jgi:hypothetical protein
MTEDWFDYQTTILRPGAVNFDDGVFGFNWSINHVEHRIVALMFNGWSDDIGIRTIVVNSKEYSTASIGETGKLDVDTPPCKSVSVRLILEWRKPAKKQGKMWVRGWREMPCRCCTENFEMRKHEYDQDDEDMNVTREFRRKTVELPFSVVAYFKY